MARLFEDQRLDGLRRAEYGSRRKTLVGYGLVATGAVLLATILDWPLVLVWSLSYFLAEVCTAALIYGYFPGSPVLRYRAALVSYTVAGLAFMSLPLYLIASPGAPAMAFAASCGLAGMLLFTLQRTYYVIELVIADCLRVTVLTLGLAVPMLVQLDQLADRLLVLFSAVGVAGFYIGSLISSWQNQRDLRDAQKSYAISQKARALGQFAGGVAHDFNNQLTAILGNLDLHDALDDEAERQAALQDCRSAAERAAITVQQLLASTGRTRLSSQPLEMEGFLFALADLLGDLLEPEMDIEVQPPAEYLVAHADRDMLETCAIQLCLNAQDATRGAGRVHIRAERRRTAPPLTPPPDAPPPYVVLIIEDNGPGVPSEALPLLAEPFYTTKGPAEGTGLGLAAVAGFARQSGGGLMLEKSPRGGLMAQIYLREFTPDDRSHQPQKDLSAAQLSGS
ncbi:ATP-binding protein [Antarctobacter jejuensis]|uniref:ATP-binding protein n=1 Tax=Antarctobacter jejuensis TaxID=1439938 RepID=UPI003FD20057